LNGDQKEAKMNDPICLSLAVVLCVFFMGWLDRFIRREKQRAQLRKRLQHNANKGSTNLGAITVAGLLLLVVLPQPAQTQEEISRRTDSAEKATRVDTVGLKAEWQYGGFADIGYLHDFNYP